MYQLSACKSLLLQFCLKRLDSRCFQVDLNLSQKCSSAKMTLSVRETPLFLVLSRWQPVMCFLLLNYQIQILIPSFAYPSCIESLKKSSGSARAALPTRYLKVGVVVEYNIYDKHHGGDLQKTLQKVKDLFHGVVQVEIIYTVTIHKSISNYEPRFIYVPKNIQDYKELNIIVSLAGVIVWTSGNLFEVNTNNLFDQADYSYQMQSRFNHDHMIRLR